jgi:hypothetical protein
MTRYTTSSIDKGTDPPGDTRLQASDARHLLALDRHHRTGEACLSHLTCHSEPVTWASGLQEGFVMY